MPVRVIYEPSCKGSLDIMKWLLDNGYSIDQRSPHLFLARLQVQSAIMATHSMADTLTSERLQLVQKLMAQDEADLVERQYVSGIMTESQQPVSPIDVEANDNTFTLVPMCLPQHVSPGALSFDTVQALCEDAMNFIGQRCLESEQPNLYERYDDVWRDISQAQAADNREIQRKVLQNWRQNVTLEQNLQKQISRSDQRRQRTILWSWSNRTTRMIQAKLLCERSLSHRMKRCFAAIKCYTYRSKSLKKIATRTSNQVKLEYFGQWSTRATRNRLVQQLYREKEKQRAKNVLGVWKRYSNCRKTLHRLETSAARRQKRNMYQLGFVRWREVYDQNQKSMETPLNAFFRRWKRAGFVNKRLEHIGNRVSFRKKSIAFFGWSGVKTSSPSTIMPRRPSASSNVRSMCEGKSNADRFREPTPDPKPVDFPPTTTINWTYRRPSGKIRIDDTVVQVPGEDSQSRELELKVANVSTASSVVNWSEEEVGLWLAETFQLAKAHCMRCKVTGKELMGLSSSDLQADEVALRLLPAYPLFFVSSYINRRKLLTSIPRLSSSLTLEYDDVHSWTIEQVCELFRRHPPLDAYIDKVRLYRVNGKQLAHLTRPVLHREWRLRNPKHIQVILDLKDRILGREKANDPTDPTELSNCYPRDIANWIASCLSLPQYSSTFEKNQIDGQALLGLTNQKLKQELGILSKLHRDRILRSILEIRSS